MIAKLQQSCATSSGAAHLQEVAPACELEHLCPKAFYPRTLRLTSPVGYRTREPGLQQARTRVEASMARSSGRRRPQTSPGEPSVHMPPSIAIYMDSVDLPHHVNWSCTNNIQEIHEV